MIVLLWPNSRKYALIHPQDFPLRRSSGLNYRCKCNYCLDRAWLVECKSAGRQLLSQGAGLLNSTNLVEGERAWRSTPCWYLVCFEFTWAWMVSRGSTAWKNGVQLHQKKAFSYETSCMMQRYMTSESTLQWNPSVAEWWILEIFLWLTSGQHSCVATVISIHKLMDLWVHYSIILYSYTLSPCMYTYSMCCMCCMRCYMLCSTINTH